MRLACDLVVASNPPPPASPDMLTKLSPEFLSSQPYHGMRSPHLNALTDPRDVEDRALALKVLLDGYVILIAGTDFRFKFAGTYEMRDGRIEHIKSQHLRLSEPFDPAVTALGPQSGEWARVRDYPLSAVLYVARYDEATRSVIQALGLQGVTWASLYVVYEWIKSQGATDKIMDDLATGWANKFTGTANHPALTGPAGRHGKASGVPMKNPMSLEQAEELVLEAVRWFLRARVATFENFLSGGSLSAWPTPEQRAKFELWFSAPAPLGPLRWEDLDFAYDL